jgi:hypothetical protein
MFNWVAGTFRLLGEVARRETTTLPGLVNLGVMMLAACAAFVTGALGTFESVVYTVKGEAKPALTLLVSAVIFIFVLVATIMCVWILVEAEKEP